MSTQEAADLLGWSVSTLRRRAVDGTIPSSVDGGNRWFARHVIEAMTAPDVTDAPDPAHTEARTAIALVEVMTGQKVSDWPPLMTVSDVAAVIGVPARTAYRMIERGDLPAIGHGRGKCVSKIALVRWLNGQAAA